MADEVRVEIAGMRSTASELGDVGTQIEAIKAALDSAVKSYAGCYGADEFGDGFAKGDGGYEKRAPSLLDTLAAKVTLLDGYRTDIDGAATYLQTKDVNSGALMPKT